MPSTSVRHACAVAVRRAPARTRRGCASAHDRRPVVNARQVNEAELARVEEQQSEERRPRSCIRIATWNSTPPRPCRATAARPSPARGSAEKSSRLRVPRGSPAGSACRSRPRCERILEDAAERVPEAVGVVTTLQRSRAPTAPPSLASPAACACSLAIRSRPAPSRAPRGVGHSVSTLDEFLDGVAQIQPQRGQHLVVA